MPLQHRNSGGRQPVLDGDFPDDDRDITDVLARADWDGRTIEFTGASGAGLPPDEVYGEADPDAGLRTAYPHGHFTGIGTETTWHPRPRPEAGDVYGNRPGPAATTSSQDTGPLIRLRARPDDRDTFPALPTLPVPGRAPRETGPMQRLPRLRRVQERLRPQRVPDCAIFAWSESISQFVMLCGQQHTDDEGNWRRCERRWADPIAASMPFTFESLRLSAHITGWRLDAFGSWACPACQLTAAYHSPRPVIHYDIQAAEAYLAGDIAGEFWHRAGAEHDLIRDVADDESRGRHRAGTR